MAVCAARGVLMAAVLLCAGGMLTGCGMSTLTSSFNGGIFGSSNKPEAEQRVSQGNLLTTAQNSPGGQPSASAPGSECPVVSVVPSDSNITFMAKGGNNDSLSVMHRGEITQTARECSAAINGGLAVKFGFSGRVLLGPQGKAGTVTLPVKITLLDPSRTALKTDQVKVPVTISGGETAGYFSIVREIVVPVPAGASPRGYSIVIAFDRRAPGAS